MSSSNSSCAACKFLRRKCTQDCVFAPYFPPDNPQKFDNVHRVFGASNVSKILSELNPSQREAAANSLAYEAAYRLRDPVYGCVGLIYLLYHKLRQVQHDLYNTKNKLAQYIGPSDMLPNMNHPGFMHQRPNIGASSYQVMPYNMQPMMGGPAVFPQWALVIRDSQQQPPPRPRPPPQQQQILEAQQLAMAAAPRKLDMFRNYEQQLHLQQNDIVRFNSGFETAGGTVTLTGLNQMIPATAAAANMPLALALGSNEGNPYGHHIQQQAAEQSHSHHPQQLDLFPYELSIQQQQQLNATPHHQAQELQTSQPHSASREEGRSFDP
ncbi:Hypothetical predicted protein [Olea europaea subsp. europaea]|uniref:LOB domain-containing protein n=1 Tax=Olea europaea subsp. europaea TaxID=158383 RepID=A0A8S0RFQ5_OLEEU|nr:Hypothetical predicted protein [Olea europaea subsp. europaea]